MILPKEAAKLTHRDEIVWAPTGKTYMVLSASKKFICVQGSRKGAYTIEAKDFYRVCLPERWPIEKFMY